MAKTEYKVGEVFQCGLVKLKCVEHAEENRSCKKCYFGYNCISEIVGCCSSKNREDKVNVIFVKVED